MDVSTPHIDLDAFFLSVLAGDDREAVRQKVSRDLEGGQPVETLEIERYRPDNLTHFAAPDISDITRLFSVG
jgi:hypothetical protein